MLEKKLIQTISAMAGAGLMGMFAAYLIYGKIGGDYISIETLFSPGNNILESAAQSLSEIEAMRNKILAGGVAGVLIGLFAPALHAHYKNI